jgi:hypothetical protein
VADEWEVLWPHLVAMVGVAAPSLCCPLDLETLENSRLKLETLEDLRPKVETLENLRPNLENLRPKLGTLENSRLRLETLEDMRPKVETLENLRPNLEVPRTSDSSNPSCLSGCYLADVILHQDNKDPCGKYDITFKQGNHSYLLMVDDVA